MATLAEGGADRIVLASEPPFRLGALHVTPALRQVSLRRENRTLEPRVMQVLVALAKAKEGIVSRDELIARCWDGRIVGENAINRVISILRALAADTEAFEIETITKVGYRLRTHGAQITDVPAADPPAAVFSSRLLSRRGALAVAGVAACGGGYLLLPGAFFSRRADAERLHAAGLEAERRGESGLLQAIASYERAVATDPQYAAGWGALARALASRLGEDPSSTDVDRARAREAADRALRLAPGNADAWTARVLLEPCFRNWLVLERTAREALAVRPDLTAARLKLSLCLSNAGRFRDALGIARATIQREPLIPSHQTHLAWLLWQTGDLRGARRVYDGAYRAWPFDRYVWTARFIFFSQTHAVDEAAAMGEGDQARTPAGGPLPLATALSCAHALRPGAPQRLRDEALQSLRAAREAGDIASFISIPFASLLGDVGMTFEQSYGYFFGQRDPATGERRPLPPFSERWTNFLLASSTTAMRRDSRFPKLTAAIGLDSYWRATGSRPDYRGWTAGPAS